MVSLRRNLLMTLAGVITVAVSLCVLGGSLLLSRGSSTTAPAVEERRRARYLHARRRRPPGQIEAVQAQLKDDPDVRSFKYLSHQDAYAEFKRSAGTSPSWCRHRSRRPTCPRRSWSRRGKAELTKTVADAVPERTRRRRGQDRREGGEDAAHGTSLDPHRRSSSIFLALLFAASLFLIVNTIRLATFARRREIEVMKLVGASNWFVRVPFMLEGMVQGVIGAALAFGAVYGLEGRRHQRDRPQRDFSHGFYVVNGDAYAIGLNVLILGAAIGVIGSIVGLRRFLEV